MRSPRTGLSLLVLLCFVVFSLIKSVGLFLRFGVSATSPTAWSVHLLAFQGMANIAFTAGAALAVACLYDRVPRRSRWLAVGATLGAAVGFLLLFLEAGTAPPLFEEEISQ